MSDKNVVMLLGWGIIEIRGFTEVVGHYFGSDEVYRRLQLHLVRLPNSGDVIAGTGGARKLRWQDWRRGKGRRGGLRVIYTVFPRQHLLLLLDVYDKDEAEDLSGPERRAIAATIEMVQQSFDVN